MNETLFVRTDTNRKQTLRIKNDLELKTQIPFEGSGFRHPFYRQMSSPTHSETFQTQYEYHFLQYAWIN